MSLNANHGDNRIQKHDLCHAKVLIIISYEARGVLFILAFIFVRKCEIVTGATISFSTLDFFGLQFKEHYKRSSSNPAVADWLAGPVFGSFCSPFRAVRPPVWGLWLQLVNRSSTLRLLSVSATDSCISDQRLATFYQKVEAL